MLMVNFHYLKFNEFRFKQFMYLAMILQISLSLDLAIHSQIGLTEFITSIFIEMILFMWIVPYITRPKQVISTSI